MENKSILMSIQPQYVAKILNGEKTIEIRKKFPKDYVGWVYLYCTKGKEYLFKDTYVMSGKEGYFLTKCGDVNFLNSKVVARFWCDKVEEINSYKHWNSDCDYDIHFETETLYYDKLLEKSCLNNQQLEDYLEFNGYAIHISKLEVFDKPKDIKKFKHKKIYRNCNKCPYRDFEYKCRQLPNCIETLNLKHAPQSWCYIEDTL